MRPHVASLLPPALSSNVSLSVQGCLLVCQTLSWHSSTWLAYNCCLVTDACARRLRLTDTCKSYASCQSGTHRLRRQSLQCSWMPGLRVWNYLLTYLGQQNLSHSRCKRFYSKHIVNALPRPPLTTFEKCTYFFATYNTQCSHSALVRAMHSNVLSAGVSFSLVLEFYFIKLLRFSVQNFAISCVIACRHVVFN